MAHKASKVYVFEFTVAGNSHFPIDMLRYDRCVPITGDDASGITNSIIAYHQERTIRLRMFSLNKEGPTKDRWKSFGWKVISVEQRDFQ